MGVTGTELGGVVVRPVLEGAAAPGATAAFNGYVRTGAALEMKAFTGATGDAGGYAIPRRSTRRSMRR